jgi:hypothetical protein
MKHLCLLIIIICLSGSGGQISAQESANASGGYASGSGSASYSVGQVFYSTLGSSVTVNQGVQQPYEISVITGIERPDIVLEMKTYPNPATDFVILKTKRVVEEQMDFALYDLSGNLLRTDLVTGDETIIAIPGLKPGTYLISVTQNGRELKTFKIIKN